MTNIILHLGAHKTATTFVQKALQKNKQLLGDAGIDVPSLPDLRNGLTKGLSKPFDMNTKLADVDTVILSDENIIGYPDTVFAKSAFYPAVAMRCRNLAKKLPHAPAKIIFSIRPYVSYFPSAFGHWLADERQQVSRADICESIMSLDRGWTDVICDIQASFPAAKIVVSEYAATPDFIDQQFDVLVGACAAQLKYDSRYFWNKSLPEKQLRELEQGIASGHADQKFVDLIRQQKMFGMSKPNIGFWTPAQKVILDIKYRQDVNKIMALKNVIFLAN